MDLSLFLFVHSIDLILKAAVWCTRKKVLCRRHQTESQIIDNLAQSTIIHAESWMSYKHGYKELKKKNPAWITNVWLCTSFFTFTLLRMLFYNYCLYYPHEPITVTHFRQISYLELSPEILKSPYIEHRTYNYY